MNYPSPKYVNEVYTNMYLELVQLRAANQVLQTENEQLKQLIKMEQTDILNELKSYAKEDLQALIGQLEPIAQQWIAEHLVTNGTLTAAASTTTGDPLPPDPTHPTP